MRTFVINLERSRERRAEMLARLAHSGLQIEFVDAIDGRSLDRSAYAAASKLSAAELGCYLSHIEVWRRIADSGPESALVLEDDVTVAPDIAELCAALVAMPGKPDMVRVSSVKKPRGFEVRRLSDSRRLLLPNRHPSGSQGYWLTRDGSRRLLERLGIPRLSFDCALDRYWRHDLQVWLMDPPAVWETPGSVSTIDQRSRRRQGSIAKQIEKWRRSLAVQRLHRQIGRELKA